MPMADLILCSLNPLGPSEKFSYFQCRMDGDVKDGHMLKYL